MLEKANKGIAILEVSDLDKKIQAINLRKGYMTEIDYDKKYEGLQHLYYDKQWFYNLAEKHNCEITIEQQNIKNYQINEYRYNVFIRK